LRIVRHGSVGEERPGLVDANGTVRDLSGALEDWTPRALARDELRRIAALDVNGLPVVNSSARLGVPVTGIGKFIAIGMNYTDFAADAGRPIPKEPTIFTKAVSCLAGPDDAVMLPQGSTHTDWEVELGVVMGATARYAKTQDALHLVAGYCLVNDLSEREFQNDRGGTWDKGKGCDTFGPVGPWLVTAGDIDNPQDVDLWLDVNGVPYQNGHTRNMIFPVAELIAYVSQFMTLEPGDILTTGTPAGVGIAQKPKPVYLKPGDVMRLGSSKLGIQQHHIESWRQI
jgi:2,4-diketo-3-deoxy-L-fuconate hydrolase